MIEIPKEKILIYSISFIVLIIIVIIFDKYIQPKRTRGHNIFYHIIYLICIIFILLFVPSYIQNEIFSPLSVLLIGTIIPIYESIITICTISTIDDIILLQYWITFGIISYSTEFMDDIIHYLPNAGEHWYEFECILYIWLLLPYTDGATLLYNTITKPYCTPIATRIKVQCEGYIGILLTITNTSYIYIVWYSLLYLPENSKRFLVVALGTIYPITASIVAVTTSTSSKTTTTTTSKTAAPSSSSSLLIDDTINTETTVWLTYWTTYNILFICMDYIENFIGSIPGFYSICAIITIYLFLPMFNGSDIIFRRILVPLSGQYENLLLRDAYLIKRYMMKSIPREHHERLFEKTAHIFLKG